MNDRLMLEWRVLFAVLAALLGACAEQPPRGTLALTDPAASSCYSDFLHSDATIAAAARGDAQAWRVPGFPFLRIDRLLASFTAEVDSNAKRATWLAHAAALDRIARTRELDNLATPASEIAALDRCRLRLVDAVATDKAAWARLRTVAGAVPDDYREWARIAGLYPLSARLVLAGVRRLQAEASPILIDSSALSATAGELYVLAPTANIDAPATTALPDALGLLQTDVALQSRLLALYAPQFTVTIGDDNDRPGQITQAGAIKVDTTSPAVYSHIAYTRFGDATLLQLVYTWWFPARPAARALDVLSGNLDGLTWRVTLDRDGQPLIYDVMHNCGCYHMFFPSTRLRLRGTADELAEPPWIPFTIPRDWHGPVRLQLASGSHYLTALAPATAAAGAHTYVLHAHTDLLSLPVDASQRASLFDEHGLVPGTTRGERWFLWPMGVRAAGSMRQWGHHATAFVGRRHFDEARLFERYFTRAASAGAAASAFE